MSRTVLVAVLLIGAGVAPLLSRVAAQQAPPQATFRSSIDLVTIDVVATTSNGAPVHNLTVDDFELLEDGVPQPVQTFQFINLASTSAVNPLPPGMASNEIEPGGLFVVVLDELGLQVNDVHQARRVADRFFKETLLPNDYVAIIRSGTDSGFFLTSDRTAAFDAIARTTGRRERTLGLEQPGAAAAGTASAAESLAELESAIETFGVGENGRESFRVLLNVVEHLRRIPARRKAVLWFSRGGNLPPGYFDAVEMGRITGRDDEVFSRLINSARAANVAIYTVDPRGLQTSAGDVERDPEPFDQGVVRDLATATGGRSLLSNDTNAALARVAAENRAYYLIGYAPSPSTGRDRARKLSVRTRVPGVSLLHRRVYLPSAGSGAAPLSLIESAMPVPGLPIALAPSAVAGEGNRRGIIVPFEMGAGLKDGTDVTYTVVALDPAGKLAARASGTVKAQGGRAIGEARLAVDAKIYQVRVAGQVAGEDAAEGLAFATVVVPEGRAKTPTCSGFVFEQAGERSALRQFTRGEPIVISTLISAEKINDRAITFGLGSAGGTIERSWPVVVGKPLARGLWRVALSLKPPLPGGHAEIRVMEDGLLLNENCRTEFVLK
ncbi:MAG: VWA domain-containing protein [Acidobacteriota bacterium]|nr:VWA domain-containing protein [Acidobacteriota bacterium]